MDVHIKGHGHPAQIRKMFEKSFEAKLDQAVPGTKNVTYSWGEGRSELPRGLERMLEIIGTVQAPKPAEPCPEPTPPPTLPPCANARMAMSLHTKKSSVRSEETRFSSKVGDQQVTVHRRRTVMVFDETRVEVRRSKSDDDR